MTNSGAATQTKAEQILSAVEEKFGFRPNLIEEMVVAPAAAQVYLGGQKAMQEASLKPHEQQAIQLAISERNRCGYCVAAHRAGGSQAGLDPADVEAIAEGREPSDSRVASLVEATRLVLDREGRLESGDVERLASRGIDRAQLYEIVALIGLKTVANYVNHIAGTELDPEFGG